jgi:large subunit ribosomal protein L28
LRLTTAAIRTIEHNGGLDSFLKSAKKADLGPEARIIKRRIEKASVAAAS